MNDIKEQQDKPENLKLLAAQRVAYERAKYVFGLQVLFTVVFAVALNFIRLLPKDVIIDFLPFILTLSFLVSIVDLLVFTKYISSMRTKAAKVQELFDCSVYGMGWNSYNSGSKPEGNFIHENFKRYVPDPSRKIENWYDIDLNGLSQEKAILLCQETNLWYDGQLRQKFKNLSLYCLIGLAIISFVISLATKQDAGMIMMYMVAPLLPAIVMTVKIYQENDKSIISSSELKSAVKTLRGSQIQPTMEELRKIQDKIFCSRKDSSLVPEWFYRKKRTNLEEGMKINASGE